MTEEVKYVSFTLYATVHVCQPKSLYSNHISQAHEIYSLNYFLNSFK